MASLKLKCICAMLCFCFASVIAQANTAYTADTVDTATAVDDPNKSLDEVLSALQALINDLNSVAQAKDVSDSLGSLTESLIEEMTQTKETGPIEVKMAPDPAAIEKLKEDIKITKAYIDLVAKLIHEIESLLEDPALSSEDTATLLEILEENKALKEELEKIKDDLESQFNNKGTGTKELVDTMNEIQSSLEVLTGLSFTSDSMKQLISHIITSFDDMKWRIADHIEASLEEEDPFNVKTSHNDPAVQAQLREDIKQIDELLDQVEELKSDLTDLLADPNLTDVDRALVESLLDDSEDLKSELEALKAVLEDQLIYEGCCFEGWLYQHGCTMISPNNGLLYLCVDGVWILA